MTPDRKFDVHQVASPGRISTQQRLVFLRFSVKAENRGVVVTEAGSYLRLIDPCITQLEAQGPSRTFNESKEEEAEEEVFFSPNIRARLRLISASASSTSLHSHVTVYLEWCDIHSNGQYLYHNRLDGSFPEVTGG